MRTQSAYCLACWQVILTVFLRFLHIHGSGPHMYRALHERFRDHYEAEKKKTDEKSVPFERVTQLYSKSSRAHVQIIGRRVDALGEDGSPYARLIIQSDSFGRVRIRSNLTNHYICLGRSGRPIGIPMKKAQTKESCVFQEVYASNHYTEFRSVISSGKRRWGLGFTKNGVGRKGRKVRPNGRAGQFLERPLRLVINLQGSSKNNGSGIKSLQEHIARLLQVYQDKL
ncbi:fibroblast growth factor 18-like [Rhopilema esculentum]|uniref:fibroblast growth factor 18-like n=1 Tax=Rhopilema esculentum TaxID=499914 RepID=UPI0031DBF6D3